MSEIGFNWINWKNSWKIKSYKLFKIWCWNKNIEKLKSWFQSYFICLRYTCTIQTWLKSKVEASL